MILLNNTQQMTESNDFVHFFNLCWEWKKMNIIDTEFFCLKLIQYIWIG